jgi:hypothetical protein
MPYPTYPTRTYPRRVPPSQVISVPPPPRNLVMPLSQGGYLYFGSGFIAGLQDGDPVSAWPDNSGNGNNATQSGSGRPIFKTNIVNGKPVLRFNAAQRMILTTPITPTDTQTIIAVMAAASSTSGFHMMIMGSTTANVPVLGAGNGALVIGMNATTGAFGGGAALDTAWHVLTGMSDPACGLLWLDGTTQGGGVYGTQAIGNFDTIGEGYASFYSTGDIAAVLFYDSLLSSTNRANVEKWLGNKYGITVAGGTAVDPTTIGGLKLYFQADSLGGGVGGVNFLKGKAMPIDQGGYSLTGQPLNLLHKQIVAIAQGAYALTGQAANVLRGRLMSMGAAAPSTDNFNRANGAIGSNWTQPPASGATLNVSSNTVVASTTSTFCVAFWNGATFADDQYSQAKVTQISGSAGEAPGLIVRAKTGVDQCYVMFPTSAGEKIFTYSGGSYTEIATTGGANVVNGNVIKFEALGSAGSVTLNVYRNGSLLLTTTTGTVYTGGSPGINIIATTGTPSLDDWEGSNVSGAGAGQYALTGKPILFPRGKSMPLVQGAYALTGQTVGLIRKRIMPLVQGAYAWNGQAVNFLKGRTIGIVQGSYALTGQAANLLRGRLIGIVKGQYNLTGQPVNFLRSRVMPVTQATYNLSGSALNFLRGRISVISQGAYALTGQPVTLATVSAKILAAAQGAFTLTGQALNFLRSRKMPLVQGAYSLTGQSLLFPRGRGFFLSSGVYNLAGQPTILKRSRVLPMANGAYGLSGIAVNLLKAHRIVLLQGAYSWSGQPVNLTVAKRLSAGQALYALSGQPISLPRSRKMVFAAGSFALNGQPVLLRKARVLVLQNGVYAFTGQTVMFMFSGGESWVFYAGSVTQSSVRVTAATSALRVSAAASGLTATPTLTASTLLVTPTLTGSALSITLASSTLKVEKTE